MLETGDIAWRRRQHVSSMQSTKFHHWHLRALLGITEYGPDGLQALLIQAPNHHAYIVWSTMMKSNP